MQLNKSKFHFIGIGGIGMCGLAELLHNMGAQVTGSDLSENANTLRLKDLGIRVFKDHSAHNVGDVDVVVYSSAVRTTNPEYQTAKQKQIPLIPRAEALAEIMHLKRGIAVAGTHGKTTTTSMVASIFLQAQTKPTIVIGGRFEQIKSTALLGDGEWLIAEADESDGSFNKLSPEIAIITNIDSDHLDHFKTFENLQMAFVNFANHIPFYGSVIVCGDDKAAHGLFESFNKKIVFYGFEDHNDYVTKPLGGGEYVLYHHQQNVGKFKLQVPGRHNALNAVSAILAGMAAGLSFQQCADGIFKFEGVDRRFHFRGEKNGIKVYDDYGHHPTEVRATLQAFREKFPQSRLVVLFQPHRYTRTKSCWHEFTTCFVDGDKVYLTDIYPAGEYPIDGITSQNLAADSKHPDVSYIEKNPKIAGAIAQDLKLGDVLICLGAGDIYKIGLEVLDL